LKSHIIAILPHILYHAPAKTSQIPVLLPARCICSPEWAVQKSKWMVEAGPPAPPWTLHISEAKSSPCTQASIPAPSPATTPTAAATEPTAAAPPASTTAESSATAKSAAAKVNQHGHPLIASQRDRIQFQCLGFRDLAINVMLLFSSDCVSRWVAVFHNCFQTQAAQNIRQRSS